MKEGEKMIGVPSSLAKVGANTPTNSGLSQEQVKMLQVAATVLGADMTDTRTLRAVCQKAGVPPDDFFAWFNPKSDLYSAHFIDCWKLMAQGFLEQYRPLLITKVLQSALGDEKASAKDRETALKMTGDIAPAAGGSGIILNQQINVSEGNQKVVDTIEQMEDGEERQKIIDALKLLGKL